MKHKHLAGIILCSIIGVACSPNHQIVLAERLMAEKRTDSAIAVMQEVKEPLQHLSDRDYALYALLMSEAVHRKGKLNAATDTLLLPAINYFCHSGDSAYAERALYCKGHLDRRLDKMSDAMQSFLKALHFLEGSNNYEQLYKVNTWLGVVCLKQGEYSGKVHYSKAALRAALKLGNHLYKNRALCDIATGYYFMNRSDSALFYSQVAHSAALTDSVPQQLTHIYTELGSIYMQKGEYEKALSYINKSIELRPTSDTLAFMGLCATKLNLFQELGQYDSAYYYYQKAVVSPDPSTQADACYFMAETYHQMGRTAEAYPLLRRYTLLSDSINAQRHTEEAIALQELYRHEQLSFEYLYWRSLATEKQNGIFWMVTLSLLSLWIASAIYFIYRRKLANQRSLLMRKEEELHRQQKASLGNLQRIMEMEYKESKMKETFFRTLSHHIVQEVERGKNIVLTDEDWDDIVRNADAIFNGFTRNLQQKYPNLNKEDLHYCCMVKMQLSQSEMSQIMHLEKDSVKKRLKRIRMEKMEADSGITLEELLRQC